MLFEIKNRFSGAVQFPDEPIPRWGATNQDALADMKERAARQLAKVQP